MRCVIIGLGVQGKKRLAIAGNEAVATVDPVAPNAQYRTIESVDLDSYDAALVCTPDTAKMPILWYLLGHGKHVLVEKPLLAAREDLRDLAQIAAGTGAACYTAYNHRFEPHIVRVKDLVDRGTLGKIHLARMFYGNGTAADVRRSPWRDKGLGVLSDLGSHLLDLTDFLLGSPATPFRPWALRTLENQAFDHVLFGSMGKPAVHLEGSLLSWKNTFTLDLIGELGSAHIHGLCKWGPSTLTVRTRVFPSGRPMEQVDVLERPDPTWDAEYRYFKDLCLKGGTNIETDIWIQSVLNNVAGHAGKELAA
jgi:scyllo-inositol 2-dehydrogenase (NADP+)